MFSSERRYGKLSRMRRQLGAIGLIVTAAILWAACEGDPYLNVEGPFLCESQEDCEEYPWKLVCDRPLCVCPRAGDVLCCAEKDGNCHRDCRPPNECTDDHHRDVPRKCQEPSDCPQPKNPRCGTATCVDNVCGFASPFGVESQREGDCAVLECDDEGETHWVTSPEDEFNDMNECTINECEKRTTKSHTRPHARGPAPSSSGFCDGQGHWVGCLVNAHCGRPSYACSKSGVCVPEWCENGVFDDVSGEAALDCGGPCDPCRAGQPCNENGDCQEGVCDAVSKLCAHATCEDGVRNGAESDIDCGGPPCAPCDNGERCDAHEGCDSSVCSLGRCRAATCEDAVMNSDETDVDCGGDCPPCGKNAERGESPPGSEER
jgi:hypothetical protein